MTVFDNHMLICAGLGYFLAQIIKCIIELIMKNEFSLRRLITGNGGMPSSHSATVCALCTTAGYECGVASPIFAITVIFAIVVMTDASGVRRETGKQAVIINEMLSHFKTIAEEGISPEFAQARLKEFIGHTPTQVLVGALLGVLIAVGMHYLIWI